MIEIKVRLYGALRRYHPGKAIGEAEVLSVPDETSLAVLLSQVKVPRSEIKLAFVNNQQQPDGYRLHNGDQVAIFPLVAGG
ncbi:MoaD/ThiS family protein [Chloroflexota bacterium]